MEKNNLIAEFMGYVNTTPTDPDFNIYENSDGKTIESMSMKYHDSWDWLMPVIDKIHSSTDYYRYIQEESGQFEVEVYINAKFIQRTWEDVVEYITWYNQSTNN